MVTRRPNPLALPDPAVEAWRALILAADGVPCRGPHQDLWTSDDQEERTAAAYRCAGCPISELCQEYADAADERHHVWAGVDRTRRPRRGEQRDPTIEATRHHRTCALVS